MFGTLEQLHYGNHPDHRKAFRGCRYRRRPEPHAHRTGRGLRCLGVRHSVREAASYIRRTLSLDRGCREETWHYPLDYVTVCARTRLFHNYTVKDARSTRKCAAYRTCRSWHFAHSYVRGNWSKEANKFLADDEELPVRPCCAEILRDRPFGGLQHFRKSRKPVEAGDAKTITCMKGGVRRVQREKRVSSTSLLVHTRCGTVEPRVLEEEGNSTSV